MGFTESASDAIVKYMKEMRICMATAVSAMADVLLPRYCIVCGRKLLLHEHFICIFCMADFPFTYNWNMPVNRMADRFNAMIQRDIDREETAGEYERYAYAAALFIYKGHSPYKRIPYRIKYHGDIGAGHFFGKMLAARIAGAGHFKDVDMVMPVPLHAMRKWSRGYNQAEIIARELSAALKAPLRTDVLYRRRRTKTQTRLGVEMKARNVEGAFSIRKRYRNAPPAASHILLTDDVFTTGATVNACFKALRSAYGRKTRISVATLGFVDNF